MKWKLGECRDLRLCRGYETVAAVLGRSTVESPETMITEVMGLLDHF